MKNIANIHDCYGCGVCAVICPKKIIKIQLNKNGFYEPTINEIDKCNECGLCMATCAYLDKNISTPGDTVKEKSYAGWSKNTSVRQKCSSGGIGFEVAQQLVKKDYKLCGVKYNYTSQKAEHFIANNIEDYMPSIGSKYIQSYTYNGFYLFNKKDKFCVTGTPCQIDSLRRYTQKLKCENNFILIDFFCHGVPSMLMWDKYISDMRNKIGDIQDISWRSKQTGWHDSWAMSAKGENNNYYFSLYSKGDIFFKFFLSDICLGKACYKYCKYKTTSSADIRIGDLWGKEYKENNEGVSAMLTYTRKGEEVISLLHNCEVKNLPVKIVAEGQMKKSPKYPWIYPFILYKLRGNKTLTLIYKYIQIYKVSLLPKHFISKIKGINL